MERFCQAHGLAVLILLGVLCAAQEIAVTKIDNPVTREEAVLIAVDSADHNFTYSVKCAVEGRDKSLLETIHSKDKLMFESYQLPLLVTLAQPTTSIELRHFYKVWDKEKPSDFTETLTPDFQTITESRTGRRRRWLIMQLGTHSVLSVNLHRSGMAQAEPVSFDIRGFASELAKHEECK